MNDDKDGAAEQSEKSGAWRFLMTAWNERDSEN
jgi:hypothetical protein